jgi:hypothetical protein
LKQLAILSFFPFMQKSWSIAAVLAIVLLGITFEANALPPRLPSGIAGQVLLFELSTVDATNPPPVPLQTTISVFAKTGRHVRLIGNFDTAADGTFAISLPPGNYIVEPAASTPYAGLGEWTPTVFARRVTVGNLGVVIVDGGNPSGSFSGMADTLSISAPTTGNPLGIFP